MKLRYKLQAVAVFIGVFAGLMFIGGWILHGQDQAFDRGMAAGVQKEAWHCANELP